jgi:hypothetical protein
MKLDLYYPDELEPLIKQVKAKCSQKGVSLSQVILHLLKLYMEEDIYIPKEDEERDALALRVIALFKECCPDWEKPELSDRLMNQIINVLDRIGKGPVYWRALFQRAYETWNGAIWNPDFNWFLDLDNHFRVENECRKRKHAILKAERKEKEKAEKQRIKQEEKERRGKEKELAKLSKLSPTELEEKVEKERLEKLEKERQERLEKSEHEPYWADIVYVNDNGKEIGGWIYPNDWTEEQQLDWEEKH